MNQTKKSKKLSIPLFFLMITTMVFFSCSQMPSNPGNGGGGDTTGTDGSGNACASASNVTVQSLDKLRDAINNTSENGAVITLAAKTYNQTKVISINNKKCITIQGGTDDFDDTVIQGIGNNDNSTMEINFKVINSDSVTFKNLTIADSYYHAIQVKAGSDYFVATNVKTWNNGESGFKVTANNHENSPHYSDYGIIEDCFIGNTVGGLRDYVEGIDIIGAKDWVIRNNTFQNITDPNAGHLGYAFFAKGNSIGTIVENNIVSNSDVAYSFGADSTGIPYFRDADTKYEHRGGIMRNNIAYNINNAGIYMNKANNFKILNNTLLNVGLDGEAGIELQYLESSGAIRNNLVDAPIKKRDGGSATMSNNITDATDNLFVDPSNSDFHLKSTASAAIDQGYSLPADVPVDFDGEDRPQGSGWDIGAYEYK